MTDARKIAASLSAIERWTLAHGHCRVPRTNDEWSADCICSGGYALTERLCRLGLAHVRLGFPNGVVRSAAGEAVRAVLIEEGRK